MKEDNSGLGKKNAYHESIFYAILQICFALTIKNTKVYTATILVCFNFFNFISLYSALCISWVVPLMTIVYFYLYVSYEHQWMQSLLDSLLIDLYSLIRWWRSIIYGWIKVYLIHLTLYSLSFLDANWIMAGENLYIVLQCCWKHAIVILGDSMTGLMSTHRWIKLSSTLN